MLTEVAHIPIEVTHLPIIDIGLIALVAMFFGILFSRLKLSSSVGYIFAGAVLGPMALGWLVPGKGLMPVFAEFGVLLIMFYLGLELNLKKFKQTGAVSFVLALAQMALVFSGGFLAAKLFGFGDLESIILGAMLVCTSTVMVAKFLIEEGIIGNIDSRIALSILILQDLFAIFTLVLITSLSAQRSLNTLVITALLFMVAVFIVVRKISKALLGWLHSIGKDNQMVFYAIGVGVILSAAADSLGLSPVIGAFFAGLALAETKYGENIKQELGLFREFFVLFFFVAFGTTIFYNAELSSVVIPPLIELLPLLGMSLAFVAVYIVGSLLAFTISGLAMGLDKYTMSKVTMLLIPLGEFVILIAAAGQPVFSAAGYAKASIIAFLLILITAPLSAVMYPRSEKIMNFLFALLPKQTRSVLNAVGENFRAAEQLTKNPAFESELFKYVEKILKNSVVILAITYISVLLKEQFVSVDMPLPLIPGLTVSAIVLLLVSWPAYKLVANLRNLVREVFKESTASFFEATKIDIELGEQAVNILTALLLTASGVAIFAWSYYADVDLIYLAIPAIYTMLSFTYLSRAIYSLLEGYESITSSMDGKGSPSQWTREFDKHSQHLADLNLKRIEAKEKAREAIEAGNTIKARRILRSFKKEEFNSLKKLGYSSQRITSVEKTRLKKIRREETHTKRALEQYFKNNLPFRTTKKRSRK